MAIYYARATGNVNGTIWATTPSGTASNLFSSFTNADSLYSNGFIVTLNVNTTVLEVRNDATNSATAGGSFTINDGVTLTGNVVAGTTTCANYTGSTSAAIVGSITGGGANGTGIYVNGSGVFSITGSVTGGTGNGSPAVYLGNAVTVNITGNVTGGAGGNAFGIGVNTGSSQTVSITGTVAGGAGSVGASVTAASTYTITGTVVGGSAAAGMSVSATATVTATRAKGNGFGNGSVGLSAAVGISNTTQTASVRVSEIEYGDLGQSPTAGPIILTDSTSNVALFYRTSGGKKTLTDAAATVDYPANSNVRSGTVFANGNRTGTCAVPAAASVASGVAVDNTTGTAVLTSATAQSACSSALTAFSSGRLANVATVDSTGAQVAAAFGN